MRKELLQYIKKDLRKQSLLSLAKAIGISQPTLHRLVHNQSSGNIHNWERIENYYRSKAV